jgi:hypothetical protein
MFILILFISIFLIPFLPYLYIWIKKVSFIKRQLRKYWEWKCKKYGCIKYGSYYGMPQAHCRRCGLKTSFAADFCEDRIEPWGEYE